MNVMKTEKIKIMLIDDHQIMIDGIKSLMNREQQLEVVATANNGKEALLLLENITVDIILMDIEMPLLNGYDTTILITSKYPHIKVICLTTHDEPSIVRKMLNAGAKGYILKNTDEQTLLKAFDTVINGETYIGSEIKIALEKSRSEFSIKEESQTPSLSEREKEIIIQIANGLSNREIAKKLNLSVNTIDSHRTNIMNKLDIHNVAGLVKFAIKTGLIY